MNKLSAVARTPEVDDTSDRLLKLYTGEAALKNEPFLKPLFAEMQVLSDKITEAIKRDQALSQLEDADAVRDDIVRRIFKIAEGYAATPLPNLKQPAERLLVILNNFGLEITRANYSSESSYIEALLKDLAAAQADVDTLPGFGETVAELRDAQTHFNTIRIEYEKARGAEKQTETATALKKPLLQLINDKLVLYLNTMTMADSAKYGTFAAAAEQIIAGTNTAVAQRARRKPGNGDETAE